MNHVSSLHKLIFHDAIPLCSLLAYVLICMLSQGLAGLKVS